MDEIQGREGQGTPVEAPSLEQPYRTAKPLAKKAKVYLQMTIGSLIVLTLIAKFLASFGVGFIQLRDTEVLAIVGHGLTYAAGVELAYMLFTPGPDEAINPAILGIASAVLLTVSRDDIGAERAVAVTLLCLAMAGLFWLKKYFNLDEHE